jgi:uncharacterized protein YmfQ (DUF2313 family)
MIALLALFVVLGYKVGVWEMHNAAVAQDTVGKAGEALNRDEMSYRTWISKKESTSSLLMNTPVTGSSLSEFTD